MIRNDVFIAIDEAGQVKLPDEIMTRQSWRPGSQILVELLPVGIRLRDAPNDGDEEDAPS